MPNKIRAILYNNCEKPCEMTYEEAIGNMKESKGKQFLLSFDNDKFYCHGITGENTYCDYMAKQLTD